jgi:Putative zinc-finger
MATDPAAHPPLTERYLLGELSDAERVEFEAHYFQCPTCAEDVLAASAFVENARAALIADRAAAPAAPERARDRTRGGWFGRWLEGPGLRAWGLRAAAVGALPLLALAGYQGLHTVPQLRQEIALRDTPRTLASVTLRPPTRGAAPAITVGPDDRLIQLAMELPAAAGPSPLLGEIVDGGGRVVLPAFSLPPPPPGEPLSVVVPVAPLEGGAHELVIRIDGRVLARYPFTVERR